MENLSWPTSVAANGIRGRLDPLLRHHCRRPRPKKLHDAVATRAWLGERSEEGLRPTGRPWEGGFVRPVGVDRRSPCLSSPSTSLAPGEVESSQRPPESAHAADCHSTLAAEDTYGLGQVADEIDGLQTRLRDAYAFRVGAILEAMEDWHSLRDIAEHLRISHSAVAKALNAVYRRLRNGPLETREPSNPQQKGRGRHGSKTIPRGL